MSRKPKSITGRVGPGGQYDIAEKIGHGSFGEVYVGKDQKTGSDVAIKFERRNTRNPQLKAEHHILQTLAGNGIPKVFWYGRHPSDRPKYNVLVMQRLGASLEDLFQFCGGEFTARTALLLAEQLMSRLEFIHGKKYLHRDIKPDNFCMGMEEKNVFKVHAIDFGLSKKYKDSEGKIIPAKKYKNLTGTARYASINAHLGTEHARRDDLESICHVLIYFQRRRLPWQSLPAKTKEEKYRKIMNKKKDTDLNELAGKFPPEFKNALRYARNLKYEQKPDYAMLRKSFKDRLGGEWPEGTSFNVNYKSPRYDWRDVMAKMSTDRGGKDAKFILMKKAGDGAEAHQDDDSSEGSWRGHASLYHQMSVRSAAAPYIQPDDQNSLCVNEREGDSFKPTRNDGSGGQSNSCCVIM